MRESFVVLKHRGELILIYHTEVLYIESNLRKIVLHCVGEDIECYAKLNSFEKELGDEFIRCHKSFLVNLNYIESIKGNIIILKSGQYIPVSNSRKNTVQLLADRHFLKQTAITNA